MNSNTKSEISPLKQKTSIYENIHEEGDPIVDETLVNCSVNDFKFSKSVDESLGTTEYWTPTDGPRQVWVNIEVRQLDKIDIEFTVTQSWLWSQEDVKRNQNIV